MTEMLPPGAPVVEISGEPTAVYRLYDQAGALLYVGISRNPAARWATHAAEKSWWSLVAKKTIVMCGSRREAELAEGRAIRTESPRHNIAMGRRDEAEPRRSARKVAAARKKPAGPAKPTIPGKPGARQSYTFDAEFTAQIDARARKLDCSRTEAVGVLLCAGLQRFEEEEREALKMTEELEELRRTIAAEVAGNPEREAGLAAITAKYAAQRLELASGR